MTEVSPGTVIKNTNLDEVLAMDPAQILEQVLAGGGEVCEDCGDKSFGKARTLASFAEIGRLSVFEAGQRLTEFNTETCGHLGTAALEEVAQLAFIGS